MKKYLIFSAFAVFVLFCTCTESLGAEGFNGNESKVLIIDPGHGGADGGAVAEDGSKESEINLSISLKIEKLCGFLGIENVMTRSSEQLEYPKTADTIRKKKIADQKARLAIVNSVPNAVLISIHQNIYPSNMPTGAQVLYSKNEGSRELAEQMQQSLVSQLDLANRRCAAQISDDIYLMKNAECTAVLVECGFISNSEELAQLKSQSYQKRLASVILASYTQFVSETERRYG